VPVRLSRFGISVQFGANVRGADHAALGAHHSVAVEDRELDIVADVFDVQHGAVVAGPA